MPTTTKHALKPWWQRLLWFVGLWAAGVASVAAVGYAIKLALKA